MTTAEKYVAGKLDLDKITADGPIAFFTYADAKIAHAAGKITDDEFAPMQTAWSRYVDAVRAVQRENDEAVEAAMAAGEDPDSVELKPRPDEPEGDTWTFTRTEPLLVHLQRIADESQAYAYRWEDFPDGSRLEIRVSCTPAIQVEDASLLEPTPDVEGHLAVDPAGDLHRCWNVGTDESPVYEWRSADAQTIRFHAHTPPGEPVLVAGETPAASDD